MHTSLNRFLYGAMCLLLFAYVYIKFSSRGALGSEDLYGYGRILALSDLVMLAFLVLNSQVLRELPPLALVIGLWLLWVLATCANLLSYGAATTVFGILQVSYCPLLFLFFYASLKRTPKWLNTTNTLFLLLLAFCAAMYLLVFRFQNMRLFRNAASLNDVYYLLLLLPWVLLHPKALWKFSGIILIVATVFWSMKRSALITMVLALVVYFLAERIRLRKGVDWRWLAGIGALVFFSLQLYSYVDVRTDGYFSTRLLAVSHDRGSGRLDIYNEVFRLQKASSFDSWVLGHGHDTVRKFNTMWESENFSAHNDWLEVLFDYGLPALALYCCLHFILIRYVLHLLRSRSHLGPPMAASYALFFVLSLTSHLILYASYFGFLMAFWGSICAHCERSHALRPIEYYPHGDCCP